MEAWALFPDTATTAHFGVDEEELRDDAKVLIYSTE